MSRHASHHAVFLAVLLLPLLAGLSSLAYASPPDQTWIPGMYDGADYDDVVSMIADSSMVDDPAPIHIAEALTVVGPVTPDAHFRLASIAPPSLRPRSPPLV